MALKTRTFTIALTDREQLDELKKDVPLIVGAIRNLAEKRLEEFIDEIINLVLTRTEREELAGLEKLAADQMGRQVATVCWRFVRFFLRVFANEHTREESPSDLAHDLAELGCAPSDGDREVIEAFLQRIKSRHSLFEERMLRKRTRIGVLPTLAGIGTTVELRGVFKRELRFGETAEALKDETKAADVQPVISVTITVDSGSPERFSFQSDPEAIAYLVEKLRFALFQCNSLSVNVPELASRRLNGAP